MLSRVGRTHSGLIAGILALALFLAVIALMPGEWRNVFRERAFDIVLAVDRQMRGSWSERNPAVPPVIVVDIDRRSLDSLGSWPWPRETMARLVEAVASAKPSVVAIDVLFAEVDTRSPAALARQLGSLTGNQELSARAADLPDGDKRLATAIKSVPATLGFVLDADNASAVPGVPVLARHPVVLDGVWRMASKVFIRCSESRALNRAMSSDTLPQANTGPGILIGDTHCEAAMLSSAGPDCERYQGLRSKARSFATAAVAATVGRAGDVAMPHPKSKRDRRSAVSSHRLPGSALSRRFRG